MKTAIKRVIPAVLLWTAVITVIWLFCRSAQRVANFNNLQSRKTLVIDAGHGGIDSGALSAGGEKESNINLAIALSARDIANFFGVKTVMTRIDDSIRTDAQSYSEHEDLLFRAETANSTVNAVLLSIHQNTYPTGQPSGAQVIYASDPLSEAWGKHTHSNLVSNLDPTNRRVPTPDKDNFLILKTAKCPALLVECGFMSNFSEIEKLLTHEYQMKLATVMLASFLQFRFDNVYT